MVHRDIDQLCIDTIRQFTPDVVQKANSGHPGAPMGCAPIAHVLFSSFLRQSAKKPRWIARDRFVLSNGHASALLYTMLHLRGYPIGMEDLKSFRELGSRLQPHMANLTPGHPERKNMDDGIDVSTGPLGQGIGNAVGMAIAAKNCAARHNMPGFELFNSNIYVLLGDGCMQEGVQSEAASLAGHLKLGNIIALYDDNGIQIDGKTKLSFTEDVVERYEAYGWHVQYLNNPDVERIKSAVHNAIDVVDKPSLIKIKTVIGFGSINEGTEKVHGTPLGDEDIAQVKRRFGFDPNKSFYIPDKVYERYKEVQRRGDAIEQAWCLLFERYKTEYPRNAREIERVLSKLPPEDWKKSLPRFTPSDPAAATRKLSEGFLNKIALKMPELLGGSADLTPSNLTKWKDAMDFQAESGTGSYSGRYIRFGVREHGMAAVCNGISAFGYHVPFGATFLNFLGYALGAIRLSALSRHHVIYIGTHDSIGLGEDGPTHQPIEMLASFRAMPNMKVYRPADGNEVSGCYTKAFLDNTGPAVVSLSRQDVPQLSGSSVEDSMKGAYILSCGGVPNVILVSTGTEVSLAVETAAALVKDGLVVRVVSMPCWEVFEEQPREYRLHVFPMGIPVVSIEAASTFGWSKWAHYSIGIDTFGESGKAKDLYKYFDLTPDACAMKVKQTLEYYESHPLEVKTAVTK